jgi:N4-gp56 family major capsid protein
VADAYFDTGLTDIIKAAYDRFAYNALRPELVFEGLAKVKPSMQTAPGSSVTFTFWDDMDAQVTPLHEVNDPELINVDTDQVTVTLAEYGAAAATTKKMRGTTFLPGVDRDVSELVGYNGGLSYDTLVRTVAVGGSQVTYAGSATDRDEVASNGTLTAAKVRYAVAKLRGQSVRPYMGRRYLSFIHPDVSVDLRQETGAAAWVEPVNAMDAARRWEGLVGAFEGAWFVEAARAPLFVNASNGAGSTGNIDVYASLFFGQQALAMAYSQSESQEKPVFVIGPVTDVFRRKHTFGWHWFGGFNIFRQEAIYRVETASSIANNAS